MFKFIAVSFIAAVCGVVAGDASAGVRLDDLGVEFYSGDRAREYSYSDKAAGFYYGVTGKNDWDNFYAGWNVMAKRIFSDYSLTVDGEKLDRETASAIVYPDRLEISNPGGLPLGITKDNILHSKYRRNPKLIELLSVLEMMEGEGSGYDLIYEINAMAAKKQPVIESSYEEVNVIQEAAIVDREILPLLDYVLQNYQLKQKNYIAFGAIALQKKVSSTELSRILQLSEEDRLRSYTTALLKQELVIQRGTKKGAHFIVNPKLIDSAKANIKTTLKTVEPHILKALIMEDLKVHPNSGLADIAYRIADADIKDIRKIIYSAAHSGEIKPIGPKSTRKYSLP